MPYSKILSIFDHVVRNPSTIKPNYQLRIVFVNSGDQCCKYLAQNHHQLLQESGRDRFEIWHVCSTLRPEKAEIPDHQSHEFTDDECGEPPPEPRVQATKLDS